ncbi:MAG TPA: glycoside hydrolase family 9 protein [Longimicrobiales bacterium]|nr:glycoside hydrolase family 9 protein [Longimicrobiales bacterium]
MNRSTTVLALAAALAGCMKSGPAPGAPAPAAHAERPARRAWIRVNLLGYLPAAPKVAVVCSVAPLSLDHFTVVDADGRSVGGGEAEKAGAFGPCRETYRLDFSAVRREGDVRIHAGALTSPWVRIHRDAYAGAVDTLLLYLREQRSGYNPVLRDSVHAQTDAILVDGPGAGAFIPVSGGWADAADYLQYVATSANSTFLMLMAERDYGAAFADRVDRSGRPGPDGLGDGLDEARHGLEWLVRMYPADTLMLNQIGDDRDHAFPDLPDTDSSDYGWGRGSYRPVYPCTGRPQGLFDHVNRSDGWASTAGKFASAMALGAVLFRDRDPAFADTLARKAKAAYARGLAHPGVCQTAPGRAPYFYEEADWADDMELAAAELFGLTGDRQYLADALDFAAREPVTPWMGRDTARHYEWYPWHNNGHYETWRQAARPDRVRLASYYRRGLEAVARRAGNGFRVGVPFIWCSNDLMASLATQAFLYRRMTGDTAFLPMERAALDWLFGANPWGTSFIVEYPSWGDSPQDPHSIMSLRLSPQVMKGGLVDGPVYRSIFQNLMGISLHEPDEYAALNAGFIVYHDDLGDYSTNEPILDGTANLLYLLAAMADGGAFADVPPR